MNLKVINVLAEELEAKFGDRAFITIRQLVDYGIYGSMSAARMALTAGCLPFVKISARRFAIPRNALLAFLKENLSQNNQTKKSRGMKGSCDTES